MSLFFEDLDQALTVRSPPLLDRGPYSIWANSFYSLRTSLQAREAVQWHAERLALLGSHRKALFPPQRAPQWWWGRSPEKSTGHDAGLSLSCNLPNAKLLRDTVPGLTNPVLCKAVGLSSNHIPKLNTNQYFKGPCASVHALDSELSCGFFQHRSWSLRYTFCAR